MPSAGCETAIPAIKRLQTYATDRSATGIGWQQYAFPKLRRTLKLAAAGHSSIPKNRHLWKAFQLPSMTSNLSTWYNVKNNQTLTVNNLGCVHKYVIPAASR
jgi:hypothetical protein